VQVCDSCGHEESHHYRAATRVDLQDGSFYIANGCMTLKPDGRELYGEPQPNPYRRCPCLRFV